MKMGLHTNPGNVIFALSSLEFLPQLNVMFLQLEVMLPPSNLAISPARLGVCPRQSGIAELVQRYSNCFSLKIMLVAKFKIS